MGKGLWNGLHEIVDIDTLPPERVSAFLTFLDARQPISDEEFVRRLAQAPEEEVDEETISRILAAETEPGVTISHDELRRGL